MNLRAAPPGVPGYGADSLSALLPGVAAALGHPLDRQQVPLPDADRVCVVLADGLGHQLLAAHPAQAPFLTGLAAAGSTLLAGCPTTTATSLGSFGTGLPPGAHGLLGYEVLDPERGVLLNELKWDPEVDPLRWQPHPTMFELLEARGVTVTSIGEPHFDGSGLTMAALRGGVFIGVKKLRRRVDAAVDALAAPGLVYLYWGGVDATGHRYGCQDEHWRHALVEFDRGMARLARRLPPGTLLVVVADHGMVDVPHADRADLADHPELAAGIRVLGGEPRMAQAYCEPGAAAEVAARLNLAFGHCAWIRTRDDAIAQGWFGPVDPRVAGRIGDVLVAARDSFVLVDSRTANPHVLDLIGQHGSLTDAEQLVPLLVEVI